MSENSENTEVKSERSSCRSSTVHAALLLLTCDSSDKVKPGLYGKLKSNSCCPAMSECFFSAYFGISEEKCLLQQRVDVSQRRVVHQEAQAGLEVTGND